MAGLIFPPSDENVSGDEAQGEPRRNRLLYLAHFERRSTLFGNKPLAGARASRDRKHAVIGWNKIRVLINGFFLKVRGDVRFHLP